MKRFIITSLCTLGLSLLSAFGINQINSDNELYRVSNTSNVNQNNADGEEQQSIPTDNRTPVAANAAKDTNDTVEVAAPQKSDDATLTSDKNKTKSQVVTKSNLVTKLGTDTQTAAQVNETKVLSASVNNNSAAKNTSVSVYKNVDLSKCDTVNEVVSELRKNGYTNITSSNVQNISSLKDILAIVQKNSASNSGSNTITPTVKPTQVPTVKPTPTTKPTPVPTSKPVITTKPTPAPTSKPIPTTKPSSTPQPTPTTKPATSTNTSGTSAYANQVLQLVNQERAKAGLSAFTTNSALTAAANKRAQETVQSFSHTRPNGSSFSTALQEYNVSFRAAGENIAYGQRTPQEVVTGWMNSPGHRANILNANFNKIGIGVYQTNGVIYWSQLFTN